jgi:hypothetical protein
MLDITYQALEVGSLAVYGGKAKTTGPWSDGKKEGGLKYIGIFSLAIFVHGLYELQTNPMRTTNDHTAIAHRYTT